MGNKAFGAGINVGKKMMEKALKDEKTKKIVTATGTGILGLIAGAILKGLKK